MKCKNCGKERSKSAITYLLNDMAVYDAYCYDCAKAQLEREYKIIPNTINSKNIKGIAQALEVGKMNQILQDPVRYKQVMESEPYKKLAERMG